jgi:hypothetical protein
VKADYCEQQKSVADEVVSIACGYVEPLNQLSDVVARLDVLVSFAQVSADAPEPYVRPRLLPKGWFQDRLKKKKSEEVAVFLLLLWVLLNMISFSFLASHLVLLKVNMS